MKERVNWIKVKFSEWRLYNFTERCKVRSLKDEICAKPLLPVLALSTIPGIVLVVHVQLSRISFSCQLCLIRLKAAKEYMEAFRD